MKKSLFYSSFPIRTQDHFSTRPLISSDQLWKRLNLKRPLLIFDFLQQIKQGTVSLATLSFTGAQQQKVKSLLIVQSLPNIIVLSVLVNGLRGGTSRGRTGLSQAPFDVTPAP